MSAFTAKICTLPRDELEGVIEDLWCRANVIQRLTYLLVDDLEWGLSEGRGKIDGENVTLTFQKRGIDCTQWLVGEAWSKADDQLKTLEDLYSKVEQEDAPVRMTGGQRNG